METARYTVQAYWDAEARRWWAESADIPGLVTEARSFDELVDRVLAVAPEIVSANLGTATGTDIAIQVTAQRTETVRAAG